MYLIFWLIAWESFFQWRVFAQSVVFDPDLCAESKTNIASLLWQSMLNEVFYMADNAKQYYNSDLADAQKLWWTLGATTTPGWAGTPVTARATQAYQVFDAISVLRTGQPKYTVYCGDSFITQIKVGPNHFQYYDSKTRNLIQSDGSTNPTTCADVVLGYLIGQDRIVLCPRLYISPGLQIARGLDEFQSTLPGNTTLSSRQSIASVLFHELTHAVSRQAGFLGQKVIDFRSGNFLGYGFTNCRHIAQVDINYFQSNPSIKTTYVGNAVTNADSLTYLALGLCYLPNNAFYTGGSLPASPQRLAAAGGGP